MTDTGIKATLSVVTIVAFVVLARRFPEIMAIVVAFAAIGAIKWALTEKRKAAKKR